MGLSVKKRQVKSPNPMNFRRKNRREDINNFYKIGIVNKKDNRIITQLLQNK